MQAVPPRGAEAVPQGRALPDRQVRGRAAPLPAGRPRPRPRAAVRVPHAAAREAEGAPLLPACSRSSSATTTTRPAASRASRARTCCACSSGGSTTCSCGSASPPRGARRASSIGHGHFDGQRPAGQHALVPGEAGRRHLGEGELGRDPGDPGGDRAAATVPAWLQADYDSLTAKVLRLPEREEISAPVQEQLIVELYSK